MSLDERRAAFHRELVANTITRLRDRDSQTRVQVTELYTERHDRSHPLGRYPYEVLFALRKEEHRHEALRAGISALLGYYHDDAAIPADALRYLTDELANVGDPGLFETA